MTRTMRAGACAGLMTLWLAAATAAQGATSTAGPRRLDDIHIEGEIPVPQVLFITAREQRRFMDFHHQRYLRTSHALGEATALPAWSIVIHAAPVSAKETQP